MHKSWHILAKLGNLIFQTVNTYVALVGAHIGTPVGVVG